MYQDRKAQSPTLGKARAHWVAPTIMRLEAGSAELTIGNPQDASNKS